MNEARQSREDAGAQDEPPVPPNLITTLVVNSCGVLRDLPEAPFAKAGCRIIRISHLDELSRAVGADRPRLAFLPLNIGNQPSMPQIKAHFSSRDMPVVVMIASNDQINAAAEAMRDGAFDCLFQPFSNARLLKTIENALSNVRRQSQAPRAASAPHDRAPSVSTQPDPPPPVAAATARPPGSVARFVAVSPEMKAVLARVDAVAHSDASVFLTGEVGGGKSLLARVIHARSLRAGKPFVRVDCASLDRFGVERDLRADHGAIDRASGGTLFLDDIGDLDMDAQPALRTILEDLIDRAGPDAPRIVAARRCGPDGVPQGTLRDDLFYRLHVAPITLPPLRSRRADIAALARDCLGRYALAESRSFSDFTDQAIDIMARYGWPGNARELINTIWSLVLTNDGPLVQADHLPPHIRTAATPPSGAPRTDARATDDPIAALVGRPLAEIERAVIEATIRAERGSVPRAARVLDVSPSTIYRKRETWDDTDPE